MIIINEGFRRRKIGKSHGIVLNGEE